MCSLKLLIKIWRHPIPDYTLARPILHKPSQTEHQIVLAYVYQLHAHGLY